MISFLRYGIDSSLALDLPAESLVARCNAPRGEPLASVAEAVDLALGEPMGFPPLVQAAVPGDKVALALDDGVPQSATIVARTVAALVSCGVAAGDIALVCAPTDGQASVSDPLGDLLAAVRAAIAVHRHDPADRGSLSYLGASANARPIYVNRAIHDADLVISIGCLRLAESLEYCGTSASVFPTFSDAASIDRFRSPKAAKPAELSKLCKLADEVSWLLGARFTIQVVPGSASEVLHVLAGDAQAVLREGTRRCDAAWSYLVPRRAELVVATIEGGASQQTWQNVGRALAAAAHALGEDGAVALCTDLAEAPGPAIQQLRGAEEPDEALHEIGKTRPIDVLEANELARALQRGKVYLVSRLDEELVEDLGMLPLAPEQVTRLAASYDSCIVLANAQYALARPRAESAHESARGERKPRR